MLSVPADEDLAAGELGVFGKLSRCLRLALSLSPFLPPSLVFSVEVSLQLGPYTLNPTP